MSRLFLVIFYYVSVVHCDSLTKSILDNELDSDSSDFDDLQVNSWVRLLKFPPKEITVNFGEIVELECEAHGGYPAPIIQWYKGNVKITDNERSRNFISSNYASKELAKLKASIRFIADKPDVYFCHAQSGHKIARAPTKVNVIGKHLDTGIANKIKQMKEELAVAELNRAKIVFYDVIYMNNIGDTAEIPCKTFGYPAPDTIWLGPSNEHIKPGTDPRFIILPSSALRISNLRWEDMGAYTCIAKNSLGEDSIETFLYPMMADK